MVKKKVGMEHIPSWVEYIRVKSLRERLLGDKKFDFFGELLIFTSKILVVAFGVLLVFMIIYGSVNYFIIGFVTLILYFVVKYVLFKLHQRLS